MGTKSTLVLDVGKTNVKLLVISKAGEILDASRRDNASVDEAPYLHIDVDGIWQWILDATATLAAKHSIDAIVPTLETPFELDPECPRPLLAR